ncbi:MAG: hypothetical protein ACREB8_04590 [Pseudolabrys sp.]
MWLRGIDKVAARQTGFAPQGDEPAPVEPIEANHALVALTPAPPPPPPQTFRQAPFLAQLLATRGQHPQTSERRRAEPQEALSAYRAAAALIER